MRRLLTFVLAAPLAVTGCTRSSAPAAPPTPVPTLAATQTVTPRRIEVALQDAAKFLASKQSKDGAWRSEVYGFFKDGPTLTPYVLSSLYHLREGGTYTSSAFDKGQTYLDTMVAPGGKLKPNVVLSFPIYASAIAAEVATLKERSPQRLAAQRAWLTYMRGRQMTQQLGWQPGDAEFGGWGYAVPLPRKPPAGQPKGPLVESNLSATIFGVEALRSGGIFVSDPAYKKVLVFLQRCQNYSPSAKLGGPPPDDGGFFFIPDDAARNKAGALEGDPAMRTPNNKKPRFRSYGSATADGLRALLVCGLPPNHPRVTAARVWLEQHFAAETNPGAFPQDRKSIQNATYYYYCQSVARAFTHLKIRTVQTEKGKQAWAPLLAAELLSRQQADGSWVNPYSDSREDDPLVATPAAATALRLCRDVMRN